VVTSTRPVFTSGGDRWLDTVARERLAGRLAEGLRRARIAGAGVLVGITELLSGRHDPSAIVSASRRIGEPWFCLEQPDRDRIALATLGTVRTLEASGPDRFDVLAARWRTLAAGALADEAPGAPGAGLVAVGGFAFAPDGGASPMWDGFAAASLILPEVALARRGDQTWLTLNLDLAPDDTVPERLAGLQTRLDELVETPLPLFDPAPTGAYEVVSPMPPAHF
jgi:hypothetical protein